MADEILVSYKAEVAGFRAELKELQNNLKAVENTAASSAAGSTAAFNKTSSSVSALRKQLADIAKAEQELIALRNKSNNPAQIDAYNKKIKEAKFEQKGLADQIQRTEQSATKATKAGSSMVSEFRSVAATIGIAFGVAQIVNFTKEAFNLSAKAEGIATAFSKIGGEVTLEKLRLATRGATSDIELMQAALRARNFGISTDLLAKGLELAGKVARTTGQDVTYLTNSFVDGLGRKSVRILDNLQISQVDLQKEIKKTGDFNTAVGNIVDKKLRETGIVVDTVADKVARLGAIFDNLKKQAGDAIINMGGDFVDVLKVLTGQLSLQDLAIKKSLEIAKDGFEKFSGKQIEEAKKSENDRLRLVSESSARRLDLIQKLQTNLSKVAFTATQFALQNETQLNNDLRNLNKKHQDELTDDELKAIKEREKAKKELRLKSLDELLNLLQKTEEEAIKSADKTPQQKLDREKEFALIAAQDARNLAIQTGTDIAVANAAFDQIILNNKKIFGEKQKELFEKDNKERYDELVKSEADLLKVRTDAEWARSELEEKERKKREDEEKRHAAAIAQIEQEAFQATASIIGTLSQINSNLTEQKIIEAQESADAEISELQKRYDADLISKDEFEKGKQAIDDEVRAKERQLKKEAFEFQKQASLIQATIATAQGVATALTGDPYTVIARVAIAAAIGAAQIALIASQPTPKFEKGGKVGGKRHSAGGTLIEAEVDEFVVKRGEATKNDSLLQAINSGKAEKFILENYIAPALRSQQKKFQEQKQSSFADNLAKSMFINSGNFKDSNLLESLKQSRKNDREIALFLAKKLEASGRSHNKW